MNIFLNINKWLSNYLPNKKQSLLTRSSIDRTYQFIKDGRYKFEQVPPEFLTLKRIVSLLIKKDETAFDKLPIDSPFKKDPEIVLTAIMQSSERFQKLTFKLRKIENIAILACKSNGNNLAYVPDELIKKDSFFNKLIEVKHFYRYLNKDLQKNYTIAYKSFRKDGFMYAYAPEEFKNNETLIEIAIKNDPIAYAYLPESFKNEKYISMALQSNALKFISENLTKENKVYIESTVTKLFKTKPIKYSLGILKQMDVNFKNLNQHDYESMSFVVKLIPKHILMDYQKNTKTTFFGKILIEGKLKQDIEPLKTKGNVTHKKNRKITM
jgi:hypothetical protein